MTSPEIEILSKFKTFDVTVIIYLFRSLFLFEGEEIVTSRFKGTGIQIISQQVNDHFYINNKPKSFAFIAILVFKGTLMQI